MGGFGIGEVAGTKGKFVIGDVAGTKGKFVIGEMAGTKGTFVIGDMAGTKGKFVFGGLASGCCNSETCAWSRCYVQTDPVGWSRGCREDTHRHWTGGWDVPCPSKWAGC